MLNSLLLMAMTNEKVPKFLPWALYLLYFTSTTINNMKFFFINLLVYTAVMLITRKITKGAWNQVTSIVAVLIWSICIDVVDYFIWPVFNMGRSLPQYVWDGILFNYKWVFLNVAVWLVVYGMSYVIKRIVATIRTKKIVGAQV